eukprot:TRINITY_DN10389_c0_g1_i11.p1 TRINITY_DN10389_c0_g1~~TRINITY_DN10389_c0_g1_i11.p1  ORF type:complete len:455 (-),score=103.04 TRINITY_DN10389_c0_g1_i11:136-1500(-)
MIDEFDQSVPDPMNSEIRRLEDDQRLISEGYNPKDGNDPCIYSTVVGVPPKSFITTNTSYDPRCPPPTYFTELELNGCHKTLKSEVLEGFSIPPEGGLACSDKEVLKRQSGVISSLVKQMIKNFSIEKMSLPVRIFEPRSMSDRVVDLWRFAPRYLSEASMKQDPVERLKLVMAFAISGLYCEMQQLKPFNPLLGETLEGKFSDGTRVYLEHTSHHPPTSVFYIVGAGNAYTMHGHYVYGVEMSTNSMKILQNGPNNVEFADGGKATFRYSGVKVHGLMVGKRMVYPSGPMTFEDPANGIRALLIFNYGKGRGLFGFRKKGTKIDDFDGIIYYRKQGAAAENVDELKDLKDVSKVIAKVSGSWLKCLKIGDDVLWDIDQVQPDVVEYTRNPLPSDWRFREDLIWLRRNSMVISQEWKNRLEAEQRRDEKLRKGKVLPHCDREYEHALSYIDVKL